MRREARESLDDLLAFWREHFENDHQEEWFGPHARDAEYVNTLPRRQTKASRIIKKLKPLIPVPFSGNLRRAKIYLLMGNPKAGKHTPLEASFESHGRWVRAIRANVLDERHDFFSLRADFNLTAAHAFFWPMLSPVIMGFPYNQRRRALEYLIANLAVLDVWPYHAKNFPGNLGWPSTVKILAFFRHFVLDRVCNEDAIAIPIFGKKCWVDNPIPKSLKLDWKNATKRRRSATLNSKEIKRVATCFMEGAGH